LLPDEDLGGALDEGRRRTLWLIAPVREDDMERVHDPLMSPLAWDLGHIAAFEDLWLCQRAGGLAPLRPELAEAYDAAETPRSRRGEIVHFGPTEALDYMRRVRERSLAVLERTDTSADGEGLNRDGFVWRMIVEHEHQHNETMLQTLALAKRGVFAPERPLAPGRPAADLPATVTVPGGPVELGDGGNGFAYDNERPRHTVDLAPFEIDTTPVTNGAFREFVEDGGYLQPSLWSEDGWRWRESGSVQRPLYWIRDGRERRFDRLTEIDPTLPVMHVSWFEADAFARWRGGRLPTEAEWEKAAAWDPVVGDSHRYPWGDSPGTPERANVDQLAFGPAPAGSLSAGSSPCGARGMVGDAWEWTASRFDAYPGFRAYPYREYSQAFFGRDFRVLRGGSWATRPSVARVSFRSWDFPQRRQIFAGFRLAYDEGT